MYVASPAASEEAPTTAKIATAGLEALRLWFQDARALARAVSAVRAVFRHRYRSRNAVQIRGAVHASQVSVSGAAG